MDNHASTQTLRSEQQTVSETTGPVDLQAAPAPVPATAPEPEPRRTHRTCQISLGQLMVGAELAFTIPSTEPGKLITVEGFLRLMPTGELFLCFDHVFGVAGENQSKWVTEDIAKDMCTKQQHMYRYAERASDHLASLFRTYTDTITAKIADIQDRYRRTVPAVVLHKAMQLGGLDGVRNLNYDGLNGCYFLMKGNLFIGIEEDGYAHS